MILGLILLGLTPTLTHGWSFKSAVSSLMSAIKDNPTLSALCGFAFYAWFRSSVEERPTLDKLKVMTHEQGTDSDGIYVKTSKGIRGYGPIIIFCHGCVASKQGFGMSTVKACIKRKLIPRYDETEGRCVSFEFDDSRATLNLGQDYDQQCIDVVYEAVRKKNEYRKIVLMGVSRGSLAILNYLGNQKLNDPKFDQLRAVVLLEPPTQPAIKEITGSCAKDLIARFIFPNYHANYRKGIFHAQSFARQKVPIFISYIEGDGHARKMPELIAKLQSLGCCNIYEYVIKSKLSHGSAMNDPELSKVLNAFYFRNYLTFDADILINDVKGLFYENGERKEDIDQVYKFLGERGIYHVLPAKK